MRGVGRRHLSFIVNTRSKSGMGRRRNDYYERRVFRWDGMAERSDMAHVTSYAGVNGSGGIVAFM